MLGDVGLVRGSGGRVLRVPCDSFEERETRIHRRIDSCKTVCASCDAPELTTLRHDLNERFPSPTRTQIDAVRERVPAAGERHKSAPARRPVHL